MLSEEKRHLLSRKYIILRAWVKTLKIYFYSLIMPLKMSSFKHALQLLLVLYWKKHNFTFLSQSGTVEADTLESLCENSYPFPVFPGSHLQAPEQMGCPTDPILIAGIIGEEL